MCLRKPLFLQEGEGNGVKKKPTESKNGETALSTDYMTAP